LKQPFRKFHRLSGSIAALFLMIVVCTGIALQHPSWFSKNSLNTPITHYVESNNVSWIGSKQGLFFKTKKSPIIKKAPLRVQQSEVVGLLNFKNQLFVAFEEGTLLQFKKNKWSRYEIPKGAHTLYSLSIHDKQLLLTTDKGLYALDNTTWKLIQKQHVQSDILYTLKKLHTGYFLNDSMRTLYQIMAWITLLLILSGTVLYFRKS
jgi:hypothetical protein